MGHAKQSRVAIIGAGIFGVSCALELAKENDVVVFEQQADIMSVGTKGNQYRHHYGFHYPRSKETVVQCKAAESDFRGLWREAIIEGIPAFYAVAKNGSKVTAPEFLDFCDQMNLVYKQAYPEKKLLNRDSVSLCIETTEPVYDSEKMRKMGYDMIAQKSTIDLRLASAIVGGSVDQTSGKKRLQVRSNKNDTFEEFDFVVNATYANHNLFRGWFGFPTIDLEFRLKELPIIRLPKMSPAAVTIMDGPFVTIVPVGHSGLYTLGDVPRSIIEVSHSWGGIPWTAKYMNAISSRFSEMKIADEYFIPIIAEAEYVRSMFSVLPVLPDRLETDERLTAVTYHGSGCWSVLEGKIVTCVTAAKQIVRELALEHP